MSPSTEMGRPVPVKDLDILLTETLGADLEIENIKWKPLTEPGENYGSLIYSVDATVRRKNITEILNLVVKLPPPSQYLMDLFNSPVNFWKELVFYRELAPAFIKLQLDNCIENDKLIDLTPRYYGGRLGLKNPNVFDNQAAVVMENLIPKGYAVQDRLLGLDLQHTQLVVKELANLHALVIGLKVKEPEFFQNTVMPALIDPTDDISSECGISMVREAHDAYKELPEAKSYMDRIDKTLIYDYETGFTASEATEPWGTMVHNDFWSNNVLFRYDKEGKPTDIKIVDFQFGYYNSGVMDLIFFLLSSAREDVLDNNLESMLDHYYKSFVNCLKSLKVSTQEFSRKGFYDEVNRCAPLRFGQCISMVSVIKAERGEMKDVEQANGDIGFAAVGNKENAEKKLLHILKIYDKKQWLAN